MPLILTLKKPKEQILKEKQELKHIKEIKKYYERKKKIANSTDIIKTFNKINKLIDNLDFTIGTKLYYRHKNVHNDYSLPLWKLRDLKRDLEIIKTLLATNRKYKALYVAQSKS
jgi:hypothetical protein